jgi:hypothetical protein
LLQPHVLSHSWSKGLIPRAVIHLSSFFSSLFISL